MKPKQIIPLQSLKRIDRDFPGIFPMIDSVALDETDPEEMERWDHGIVYAPIGLAKAAMQEIGGPFVSITHPLDLALIAALAGWRRAKTVYDFSTALSEELIKSAQSQEMTMPVSAMALPYWSIYIRPNFKGWDIDGFFVYYDEDISETTGQHYRELRFTPIDKDGFPRPTLYLIQGPREEMSIKDCLGNSFNALSEIDIPRNLRAMGIKPAFPVDIDHQSMEALGEVAAQLVSFVLYLSAVNADMKRDVRAPFKRTKNIQDIAREVEHIHVGDEVAVRIRTMNKRQTESEPSEPLGGHHRSPVMHIRRAHWHTFHVGEGRKGTKVKWLAPMLVNPSGKTDNVITIHKIGKQEE